MTATPGLVSWLMARGAGPSHEHEALCEALVELDLERPQRARRLALSVLARTPRSKLAHAVWAHASDAMGLEEEVSRALTALAERIRTRADLYWRLSLSEQRLGRDGRAWAERALAAAEPRPDALRAARWLFQDALDHHQVERAERFAQHLKLGFEVLENTHLDLAELDLEVGRFESARRHLAGGPAPPLLDARGWLTTARAARGGDAKRPLQRAVLLGSEALVRRVGACACLEPDWVALALPLVQSLGLAGGPEWTLAKALSGASGDEALAACACEAARNPLPSIAWVWLRVALVARDRHGLQQAVEFAANLAEFAAHPLSVEAQQLLDWFAGGANPRAMATRWPFRFASEWAEHEFEVGLRRWLERSAWDELFETVRGLVLRGDDSAWSRVRAKFDAARSGPLTLAVVGEFNAGKSSLVNALLGERRAAVGVTPTTAEAGVYDWQGIKLLDTPGFNAPGNADARAALATLAASHAALWVSDATLPFSNSEARRVQILQGSGMPFWVLLNKRDRLSPAEVDEVAGHVEAGLSAKQLKPVQKPRAVAARGARNLAEFCDELSIWLSESDARLRRQACARVLRAVLDEGSIPSSAEPRTSVEPLDGRSASPQERALSRVLKDAENNLKR